MRLVKMKEWFNAMKSLQAAPQTFSQDVIKETQRLAGEAARDIVNLSDDGNMALSAAIIGWASLVATSMYGSMPNELILQLAHAKLDVALRGILTSMERLKETTSGQS